MHTPDEASKLWCPMVRMPAFSQVGPNISGQMLACNRGAGGYIHSTASACVAERCAMWRWGRWREGTEQVVVDDPARGIGGKRVTVQPVSVPTHGFCGLAGPPLQPTTRNNE